MSTTTRPGELAGDYVLDTAHTRIGFVARHTMGTKVRGQFDAFEGSAHLDGDRPSQSGAQLTIRATSIQTHHQQRDDQLRATFLHTDDHPYITFTSTRVEPSDETHFKVTGDLTLHGVTHPITVDVELTGAEHDPRGFFRVDLKGTATINRKDWGVNWNAATAVLVSPKVTLEFDIAAIRRA
ncbi:YceI family protein [Streptomyces sp. NPDC059063]|uniref:YceI family protein n=1 Tax=unclassified Streptomyces TaxID=2593676 RepID=UPI003689A1EF